MPRMLLALSAALLSTTAAQAATIGFDDLAFNGTGEFSAQFVGSPFETDGFTFTSTGGVLAGFDISRFLVLGDMNPRNADPGGATLVSNREGALNTLTRTDGQLFDLLSIDLSGSTGFDGDGGTVRFFANGDSSSFFDLSFGSDTMLTSFTLPFRGVSSVSFAGQGTAFFQVDNVVANAIPEPATWAMMIGGFGLVGAAMRRRRPALATA